MTPENKKTAEPIESWADSFGGKLKATLVGRKEAGQHRQSLRDNRRERNKELLDRVNELKVLHAYFGKYRKSCSSLSQYGEDLCKNCEAHPFCRPLSLQNLVHESEGLGCEKSASVHEQPVHGAVCCQQVVPPKDCSLSVRLKVDFQGQTAEFEVPPLLLGRGQVVLRQSQVGIQSSQVGHSCFCPLLKLEKKLKKQAKRITALEEKPKNIKNIVDEEMKSSQGSELTPNDKSIIKQAVLAIATNGRYFGLNDHAKAMCDAVRSINDYS